MENNFKFEKLLKMVHISIVLILVFLFTSTNKANINHAKIINQKQSAYKEIQAKGFAYTFKVSDKLVGNGDIVLSLEKNKLTGKATGIGMICQCNVDFITKISGRLNDSKRKLNIEVEGIGDPIGILIPGKVTFKGPLKGFLNNGKVCLTGKVDIKGKLAQYAGFKNKEEILIEIPDPSLAKAFKELQSSESLASL